MYSSYTNDDDLKYINLYIRENEDVEAIKGPANRIFWYILTDSSCIACQDDEKVTLCDRESQTVH